MDARSTIEGLWGQASTSQRKAAVYGAVLVVGALLDSKLAMGIGLGGLTGSIIDSYANPEDTLLRHPAEMNAFFRTQGALSAVRSPMEARALRRRRRQPQETEE